MQIKFVVYFIFLSIDTSSRCFYFFSFLYEKNMTPLAGLMTMYIRMMHTNAYTDIRHIARYMISIIVRKTVTISFYAKDGETSSKRNYEYRDYAKRISSIMEKTYRKK